MTSKLRILLSVIAAMVLLSTMPTQAVPARRGPITMLQPDGKNITVLLHGDEWCHWTTDLGGNLLVTDERGFLHIANATELAAWETEKAQLLQRRAQVNAARHERLRYNRRAQAMRAKLAGGADNDSIPNDSIPADSIANDSIAGDSIVYDPDSLVCDSTLAPHFGFPTRGKVRGLVVLVEFQDVRFTIDDPHQSYVDMMTKDGYDRPRYEGSKYKHIGSAHDFFHQNSCGEFDPQFDVFGPILLKDSLKYYGRNNDAKAWEMITEACDYLNDSLDIDFSAYDTDNNGIIDFVFAFYAGKGENYTGMKSDIWPHAWDVWSASGKIYSYDDLALHDYACSNELYGDYMDGVGTFCHEFTHVLGLPDLYNTANGAPPTCTPCGFDLLDEGCYNYNSFIPAGMSAYERYELGWLTPVVLSEQKTDTLMELSTSNQAFIVPITEGLDDPREGEYYLFENRQLTGWDAYIPGHGMLAWHIDYKSYLWTYNTPNNWPNHQCIDLVEAGGKKKSGGYYVQDASAPFPGTTGATAFTDDTAPAFSGWTKPGTNNSSLTVRLEKPISNIQELEYVDETGAQLGPDIITFDFRTAPPAAIETIEIEVVPTAPRTAKAYVNGQLLIQTEHGTFDAMGRRK